MPAQTGRARRDGSVLAQSEVNHKKLGRGLPKIKERKTVVLPGLPPLVCSKPDAFAKPLPTISLRQMAFYFPPFQPCTWFQLAMIFCFTSAGNGT